MLAAVMRIVPAGLPRSSPSAANSASISSNRGVIVSSSLSPASVGATLRVVHVSSRIFSRSSKLLMIWLRADRERPSLARPC